MRRKMMVIAVSLSIVVFVFISGCGLVAAHDVEKIKIGILLPLSGPAAPIGVNSLNGHKLAVEEINKAGGIYSLGNAKLELVVADSGGDPKVGMTQAERLITKDNVIAIMGAYQSSVTYPSTQVAEKYGIPYIVPSSYLPAITQRGFKYTFRICLNSDLASKEQIALLDRMGRITGEPVKTLGLIYENTDWGESTGESWKKYAREFGFEVILDEKYPANSPTLRPVVSKIKAANPDALLFASYTSDAILLTNGIAEQKINAKAFVATGGGHADPVFLENVGANADYYFDLVETEPNIDMPQAREENEKYRKIYGVDMSDDCIKCYTATYVLRKAIEIAGSTDPKEIRRVLANIKMVPGQRGIITPYSIEFGPDGQNIHARALFVQFHNQERVVVYPPELALPGANIIWPAPTWEERK